MAIIYLIALVYYILKNRKSKRNSNCCWKSEGELSEEDDDLSLSYTSDYYYTDDLSSS